MPMKKAGYYTLNIQPKTIAAPTDATVYFFGQTNNTPGSAWYAGDCIVIPRNGIIAGASITIYSGTAAGTNEAWALYIRKNDATDYLIATVSAAASNRYWTNNNLSIPVTAGDTILIKTTTPTWVTNPQGCTPFGYLILRG